MEKNGYYGKIDDKPDTERELFKLQDELFNKRDEYDNAVKEWIKDTSKPKPIDRSTEPWSKMLCIIYNYASSLIKKSTKGKKYIDPDDIADKALEAAFRFMSAYNRKPNFAIGASFAGNLRWKVVEVLNEQKNISLNQPSSYDAQTEILDTLSEDQFTHVGGGRNMFRDPSDVLVDNNDDIVGEVLFELDQELGKESKIGFLSRLYLLINIRVPKTRHIRRLFLERWAGDYKVERVLESTILEVYNRCGQYAIGNTKDRYVRYVAE